MNNPTLLILLFFILNVHLHNGQSISEQAPPEFIKTITFSIPGSLNELPVIELGQPLILEFDDLNGNEADYYYTIEHFNFDWTPSTLVQSEFMDGFDNQRIRAYENSFNTYQIFSHYTLTIPNDQTRGLKVSGNYMLYIYDSYNELVFTRKFMVYENQVHVGVALKRSRDMDQILKKQRVELIIDSNNMQLNNPNQTVKAIIIQNNNLQTAITNIKPQYTLGNQLIYKYDSETSFWGGNEYFLFENKDVRASNNGIQFIELKDLYHAYLYTNIIRANRPYTYNPDINGNYLITNIDATNPNIEADYVWIHFSLEANEALKNKQVHVYGSFNNYALDESTRMTYMPDSH